jgi:hypothetical protein
MNVISSAVQKYNFQVCRKEGVARTRSIDLSLQTPSPEGIDFVSLSFEERHDFSTGEQHDAYLEIKLPLSYVTDILYLLEHFSAPNSPTLDLGYDLATSQVSNFGLKSVN